MYENFCYKSFHYLVWIKAIPYAFCRREYLYQFYHTVILHYMKLSTLHTTLSFILLSLKIWFNSLLCIRPHATGVCIPRSNSTGVKCVWITQLWIFFWIQTLNGLPSAASLINLLIHNNCATGDQFSHILPLAPLSVSCFIALKVLQLCCQDRKLKTQHLSPHLAYHRTPFY